MLLPEIGGVFAGGGSWWAEHLVVVVLVAGGGFALWAGVYRWWRYRSAVALRERARVEMVPAAEFAPTRDEVVWFAGQLARVPAAGGVLPPRARAVRVRLGCEHGRLTYAVEGPERAAAVLRMSAYQGVEVVQQHAQEVPRIRFEGAPPLDGPRREGA